MPFGLDLKSVVVGLLVAYFLIPWIRSLMLRSKGESTA